MTAAAMEVSSHALALGRVAGTSYDVAVFTNLSQDHLDFHDGIDDYFAAKASLFTPGLRPGRGGQPRRRARAGCSPPPRRSRSPRTPRPGTRPRTGAPPTCAAGADGSAFRVIGPGGVEADASVALPGPFNVANALGAIVALVEAGVGIADGGGRRGRLPRACPAAWSGSRRARTSPCSSTTRTSPARSRRCWTRCGRSRWATSRSCWAAAATGTGPSAR